MPRVMIVSRTLTKWMPNRVPPLPWKVGRRKIAEAGRSYPRETGGPPLGGEGGGDPGIGDRKDGPDDSGPSMAQDYGRWAVAESTFAAATWPPAQSTEPGRSEERRVGKEWR